MRINISICMIYMILHIICCLHMSLSHISLTSNIYSYALIIMFYYSYYLPLLGYITIINSYHFKFKVVARCNLRLRRSPYDQPNTIERLVVTSVHNASFKNCVGTWEPLLVRF
ncbi:hypothetical protein PUN28_002190 [Cardiocondyla obscurior]|uniref:Uncharacterized protein n=1 Tax=Cardiocondyla obscurior TaxID=286306 RepID=A0AAW2GT17_9HYME